MKFWSIALFTPMLVFGAQEPFWRAKAKVYEQVVEQRKIIVSVTSQKNGKESLMKVSGGGRVKAPREFVQKESLNFEKFLPKISYVESYQVDKQRRFLFVKVNAYGFKAGQKITWSESVDGDNGQIHFKITSGVLSGFSGVVNLDNKGPRDTDVGIEGSYNYDEFPMPGFFLSFGLEVIFHRLSVELRSFIEESFKNENTGISSVSTCAFSPGLWS